MVTTSQEVVLALGGGAARGWAHVGVVRWFLERGISVKGVAGTSIGALVGAFLAAGNVEALWSGLAPSRRRDLTRFFDVVIGGDGLFAGGRVVDFLRENLPVHDIAQLSIPFAAVAVDLNSGEEIVFKDGNLLDAVRASISLPGVFTPLRKDGRVLVDGGLANPLPVDVARTLAPGVPVCAVDLNGHVPASFFQLPQMAGQTAASRWLSFRMNLRRWMRRRQLKTMLPVATASLVVIQQQLTAARLKISPPDIYLKPDLSDIELWDFHKAEAAMRIGYEAARQITS
ncbi:MAG: patatin-like phospholipase family protein [Lentisphaeria bacterium]|nr:patatin-like phospholipase family protein [Lentisphaeria bacterium]